MPLTKEQLEALQQVTRLSPVIRIAVAMVKLYPTDLLEQIKVKHGKA